MKSPYRNLTWLVVGAAVLLATLPAMAENTLEDMRLFAPVDITCYGDGPEPHDGFFFAFDGVYWSIKRPNTATIGASTNRRIFYDSNLRLDEQVSSLNTGEFHDAFTSGNRFQFGRVGQEHGWMGEVLYLQTQEQRMSASHATVNFNDPTINGIPRLSGIVTNEILPAPVGQTTRGVTAGLPESGIAQPGWLPPTQTIVPLPTNFWDITAENKVDVWGVELAYLRRFKPLHHGGSIEMFLGARYFEFNEQFNVETFRAPYVNNTSPSILYPATRNPRPRLPGEAYESILANSWWNTEADNHIIGPQLGLRYFHQINRWTLSAEGRATAGINMQSIMQAGELGSELLPTTPTIQQVPLAGQVQTYSGAVVQPFAMGPVGFRHVAFASEFTPIIEARTELAYQLTRAIEFRVGWNGIWMDNIARPSGMVDYSLPPSSAVNDPPMGIDMTKNRQDVFITGVNVGITVNR